MKQATAEPFSHIDRALGFYQRRLNSEIQRSQNRLEILKPVQRMLKNLKRLRVDEQAALNTRLSKRQLGQSLALIAV